MKRNKIMFVIAIVAMLAVLFVACDDKGNQPEHTHTYGAWNIATQPTEDAAGTATRACACGETETTTVAKLSDTTVWTVTVSQDATHETAGFKAYKSDAFGTVTLTFPKGEHVYGAWEISKEPTKENTGVAIRKCACGHFEEVTLAVLTNTSVWTLNVEGATHETTGKEIYTSEYGVVTIVTEVQQHVYGAWTDNHDGTHSRTCACGDKQTEDCVYDQEVAAPDFLKSAATCTAKAVYYKSCVCGAVDKSEDAATFEVGTANGHDYYNFQVVSEPTCTDAGQVVADCRNCDHKYNGEIPALGHDFSGECIPYVDSSTGGYEGGEEYDEEGGSDDECIYHVHTCTRCDAVDTAHKEKHAFGEATYTLVSPVAGWHSVKKNAICEDCGYKNVEDAFDSNYVESDFFTKGEEKAADYNEAGYVEYTYKSTGETFRIYTDKLVAPYEGKTYYPVQLFLSGDDKSAFRTGLNWDSARLTINNNGEGEGDQYPFRGTTKISMVDANTGEINWNSNGESYVGYVDFETGMIVRTRNGLFDDVFAMIPVDSGVTSDGFSGSAFAGGMAASYTAICNLHETHSFNMFIGEDGVRLGVDFVDNAGNSIAAKDCANASYVKVVAKDGTQIVAYQKNANGVFKATDNLEGTYDDTTYGEVVLDGIGGAKVGALTGTYAKATDKDFYELYVGVDGKTTAYYTFTLTDGIIALVKPMTTITYDTAYGADSIGDEYKQANNNVSFVLPVLSDVAEAGNNVFVGWKIEGQDGYVTEYTPDGTPVTFTAVWKSVYTVTIVDGVEGVESIKVPEGEIVFDRLPKWGDVGNYEFVGWFVDVNSDGKYTEADDEELDETMTATGNITLIAVWKEIPAYVGTYYGTELWYQGGSGNRGGSTLTIDKQGNISGLKTGKVNSYDAATQTITWTGGKFYFDADAKIILGIYKDNDIADDYYFFAKDMADSNGKVAAQYGVYAFKEDGGTVTGYYAQFIQAKTALGDDTNVFTYRNKIYSGVEIKDAKGNMLVIDKSASNSIGKSASVVVYKDGKIIFARSAAEGKATIGDSTSSSAVPRELDEYFGTYTCEGKDNLVLDGAGGFAWGTKSGTYTVTDAETKKFDLYVVENSSNVEYYTATLNGSIYSVEKPEITIAFVVPEGHNDIASIVVNAKVKATLPDAKEEGYIFNGYYTDSSFAEDTRIDENNYIPVESVTLYAKYSTPVNVVYHYNDGTTEDKTVVYSKNDKSTVKAPSKEGYSFGGWYLDDATFENEWDGIADVDKDVYAKWVECAYARTYTYAYVSNMSTSSSTSYITKLSTKVTFDGTTGKGTFDSTDKKERLPFENCSSANSYSDGYGWDAETIYLGYEISVASYDSTTGRIEFAVVKKGQTKDTQYTFYGVVDEATGIIVASYKAEEKDITSFALFMPSGYSVSVSYATTWSSENTVLDYKDADNNDHTLLVCKGEAHLDAKVVDIDGNHIACNDVAKADCVLIYTTKEGTTPDYALGYNGTKLVDLDGYQGKYTSGDIAITLNGMGKITDASGNVGTYTVSDETKEGYDVVLYAIFEETSNKVFINLTERTYEMASNLVTVTYVNDGAPVEPQSVYVGVKTELSKPEAKADMVFRGWYVQDDETQTLVSMTEFVATKDVTLVAKWDAKVTLTIVYGGDIENATYDFGAGDALNMSKYIPAYADGMAFDHWYTIGDDGETQTVFNAKTIEANITVYAAYVQASCPFVGTFSGVYVGAKNSNYDPSTAYANQSITIKADGTVSGSLSGQVQNYNSAANTFEVVSGTSVTTVLCDVANGVFAYKTSSTSWYVFFANAKTLTMKSSSNNTANFANLDAIAFTVVMTDASGNKNTVTTLLNKDVDGNYKVYGNVTLYANDAVVDNAGDAAKSLKDSIKFVDNEGNTIVEYVKNSYSYKRV